MNKIVKKFRQLFRNGGYKWKSVAAGGLMAVGIIGICIVCGQTYRRSRAEAELEKLSENTDKVWTPEAAVHLLTLSTCVTQKPERRYLVQGILLNGE